MSDYVPVPVDAARFLAKRFGKCQVVVLSYDDEHELTQGCSYGATAWDKENAAASVELCVQALGGDLGSKQVYADFHQRYDAGRFEEAMEILLAIRKRGGVTLGMLAEIDQFLNLWAKP